MTVGTDFKIWIGEVSHSLATSELLNSDFVTALLGALAGAAAGAWAGAYIAQRIAARVALREQMLSELRSTNAAISVAYSICQSGFRLKTSGVQDLKGNFDRSKAEIVSTINARSRNPYIPAELITFIADMETITPFPIPTDVLQNLVFEKITLQGRPHQLALQIPTVWHSLTEAIIYRNQLISEFRTTYGFGGIPYQVYFGLPDEGGHIDARYSTLLEAIYQQTDDCIWFAKTLSEDLQQHGEIVHKAFVSRFGRRSAPRVTTAHFAQAEERGLLPPGENYKDWVTGFIVQPSDPTRLARIKRAVVHLIKWGTTAVVNLFKWICDQLKSFWSWCVRKVRNTYFTLCLLKLWK